MLEIDLGTLQYSLGYILEKSDISGSYGCEGEITSITPLTDNTYAIKCIVDHNNYEVYLTLEIELLELLWVLGAGTKDGYQDINVISVNIDDVINTPPTRMVPKKQLIKDLQESYKYNFQFSIRFIE